MPESSNTMDEIVRYLSVNRRVGHTHVAVNGVKDNGGIIIVMDDKDRYRLKSDYNLAENQIVTLHEVATHGLVGRIQPVVIDNHALSYLLATGKNNGVKLARIKDILEFL